MVAQSVRGTRVIPAHEFFAGIMTTRLAEDELLTEERLENLFGVRVTMARRDGHYHVW